MQKTKKSCTAPSAQQLDKPLLLKQVTPDTTSQRHKNFIKLDYPNTDTKSAPHQIYR